MIVADEDGGCTCGATMEQLYSVTAWMNRGGLTQEKLGELTGLDRGYISGVERGVRNPAIQNIEKIAKALKVKPAKLFE